MSSKRTPLYADHVAAGGRMVSFAGWEMPVKYSGVKDEHLAVRSRVGLFDVSHMGEVTVSGPDALRAVNWLVSNDISRLSDGQAAYAVMCNDRGGIVDDLFVYRMAEHSFLIVVNAANRDKDFAWMQENNRFPDTATFTDITDKWALLAIQGPLAQQTLATLTALDLSSMAPRTLLTGDVVGIEGCMVARTGYTGEDGFEAFVPASHASEAWKAILAAGASHGILPCGLGARDTLRLEARNALYGHELTEETSPLQAGLSWVVKMDKEGGFLGLDAIKARKGKASHVLAGLVMQDKRIPREGMKVLLGDQEIGWVTSGTLAPTLGKGIALAYLKRPHNRPGTAVVVQVRRKTSPALVHRGPFYRRDS